MNTEPTKTTKTRSPAVKSKYAASVRITPETKKAIVKELARLNKEKKFGTDIKADQLIGLAITLLKPEHYLQLQNQSMSNKDRVEQKYQEYLKTHDAISMDEFFGILLSGGLVTSSGRSSNPPTISSTSPRPVS